MTSSQCQVCTSPTGDGSQLCSKCVRKLSEELTSVSWLVTELEVTRTRQARFTRQQDGNTSSSATTPLPWDDRASLMQGELHATISAWALHVSSVDEDSRDPLSAVNHETQNIARWLNRNMITLRKLHHGNAGRAHAEILGVIRRARVTVDRPPDLVTYGVCGNSDNDRPACPEYLYALPKDVEVKCRRCKTIYDLKVRKAWMLTYVADMFGTTSEVSTYLRLAGIKISGDAVRALARRDRIKQVGMAPSASGKAVPLYRFSDVIVAVSVRYIRVKTTDVHASQ